METIELKDEYVNMKGMTHKQLATIVTHMSGRGMAADFTNGEHMRSWARYYALLKKPWERMPDAPKKKLDKDSERY